MSVDKRSQRRRKELRALTKATRQRHTDVSTFKQAQKKSELEGMKKLMGALPEPTKRKPKLAVPPSPKPKRRKE